MSITTKMGDKGMTSLCGGMPAAKDSLRIRACGELDELCCFLGLSKSIAPRAETKKTLESIQAELFISGQEIASPVSGAKRLKTKIAHSHVARLESLIDAFEKKNVSCARGFTLPGQTVIAGTLDIARAFARRLERTVVTLRKKKMLRNDWLLVYLNRLSDVLYLLARRHERTHRVVTPKKHNKART